MSRRGENLYVMARNKIARFLRNAIDETEERRHKLAERNQVDLVVPARLGSIRAQQQRRVKRLIFCRICDRPKQEIAVMLCDFVSDVVKRRIAVIVERRWQFR